MKIGKDAVVMGNVSPDTEVGDGSVVIGPIDAQGNTIIQPMAVGRNAQAGPQSIAIGASAGAGFNTSEDLTSAVAQIQSFIDRLQQQGKSPEEAQAEVAQNIATQAQNNPANGEKLMKGTVDRHCHSNRCGHRLMMLLAFIRSSASVLLMPKKLYHIQLPTAPCWAYITRLERTVESERFW
jgi:hypothetical protein